MTTNYFAVDPYPIVGKIEYILRSITIVFLYRYPVDRRVWAPPVGIPVFMLFWGKRPLVTGTKEEDTQKLLRFYAITLSSMIPSDLVIVGSLID
jgi:hypothetical protein